MRRNKLPPAIMASPLIWHGQVRHSCGGEAAGLHGGRFLAAVQGIGLWLTSLPPAGARP